MYSDTKRRRISDDFGETIARFPARGCELFTEWRSAVELGTASTRIDGPVSTTRRRPLWSTYDQLKQNLAGLAARRVTLWSCWAPRVPRLQVSRGATELLVSYITDMCKRHRVFKADIRENPG